MNKLAIISAAVSLAAASNAGAAFNLSCRYNGGSEAYGSAFTISSVNDQVHFCGERENGLIPGAGVYETNLRQIELKGFVKNFDGTYAVDVYTITPGNCPRCTGEVQHASTYRLDCVAAPAEPQLCRAQAQGPKPELGALYNKALRQVGEYNWVKVPWLTLYSPASGSFAIYTFGDKYNDSVEVYTSEPYAQDRNFMKNAAFVADVQAKLAAGYKTHSYSTNKEGLEAAYRLLGFQIK